MHEARATSGAALLAGALLFVAAARPSASSDRAVRCAAPRAGTPAAAGASARVTCAGVGRGELEGPARLLFDLRVDPNRADRATLEALPGLGPGRAAALIAARRERPLRGPHDLDALPGFGPITLERLAPWLMWPGEAAENRTRDRMSHLLPENGR